MPTLYDSTRRTKPTPFAVGLSRARRMPYSVADEAWWTSQRADMTSAEWDAMAAESFALDRLEAGLCL